MNDVVVKKGIRDREAWWVWRWDRTDAEGRRDPVHEHHALEAGIFFDRVPYGDARRREVLVLLPFNVGVGFSIPVRVKP